MRIGLQIPNFTWPGGPESIVGKLAEIAHTAEQAIFNMPNVHEIVPLEPLGREIIQVVAAF